MCREFVFLADVGCCSAAHGQGRSAVTAGLYAPYPVSLFLSGKERPFFPLPSDTLALEIAMQRNENRREPRGVADLLLPYALIDDGILLQRDGSLLAGWSYRGPDMMSAAPAEMNALSARLNSILRLGTGWMVQCDAIRSRAPGYPQWGSFPDPVTRVIDDERRQQFLQEDTHFESEYFFTVTCLPPIEAEERIKSWMFEGGGSRNELHGGERALERFRQKLDNFENVFRAIVSDGTRQRYADLHECGQHAAGESDRETQLRRRAKLGRSARDRCGAGCLFDGDFAPGRERRRSLRARRGGSVRTHYLCALRPGLGDGNTPLT